MPSFALPPFLWPQFTDSVVFTSVHCRELHSEFGIPLEKMAHLFNDCKQIPNTTSLDLMLLTSWASPSPEFYLLTLVFMRLFHDHSENELPVISSVSRILQIEKLSLDSSFAQQSRYSQENHLYTHSIWNHHVLNLSRGEGRASSRPSCDWKPLKAVTKN